MDIFAADRGIGGASYDYKDLRSQQLLSRLIEKLRAIPQPIIAAVQVGLGPMAPSKADCLMDGKPSWQS